VAACLLAQSPLNRQVLWEPRRSKPVRPTTDIPHSNKSRTQIGNINLDAIFRAFSVDSAAKLLENHCRMKGTLSVLLVLPLLATPTAVQAQSGSGDDLDCIINPGNIHTITLTRYTGTGGTGLGLTGAQTDHVESADGQPVKSTSAVTVKFPQSSIPQADYLSALQGLLNTNYAEYEIVFSSQFHPDEDMQQWTAFVDTNPASGGTLHVITNPIFYRLRYAKDGFFVRQASSLAEVQTLALTNQMSTVRGVWSNTYWQITGGLLLIDHTRLPAMTNAKNIRTWKDLADEADQYIFSLGLWIKRSSVIWDGTNFTGEASTPGPKGFDPQGKRLVTGYVILSNGIPWQLNSEIATTHFSIHLGYYDPILATRFKIPSQMDVVRTYFGGATNHVTLQIFSLKVTHFPPDSTQPAQFADPHYNPALSIIEKYTNGTGVQTQRRGQPIPPAAVRIGPRGP